MARDSVDGPVAVDLPTPVVEDLLASRRRRYLLAALAAAGEPVPLDDLAGEIRAREREADPASIPAAERRRLRRELLESDLPKLTAAGVVGYDSMLATVELEAPALGRQAQHVASPTGEDA
jgi:hypothetical protein